MSVSRRIRRQAERNQRSGQIHAAGFTGRRKQRANRFLKQRAKRDAAAAQKAKPVTHEPA